MLNPLCVAQVEGDSFGDEDYYDGCGDSEHCNDEITVRRAKFLKAMRDKFVDGLERSGPDVSPKKMEKIIYIYRQQSQ